MTRSEQRGAEQALRRAYRGRGQRERQLRQALAAERRLTTRREGSQRAVGRRAAARYAYLTESHD
jgi:hypothetical protein